MADNAIDIITRNVTAEIAKRFEGAAAQFNAEVVAMQSRADALFAQWEADGQRRMDELFATIPTAAVVTEDSEFSAVAWFKRQARSRAWRTLLQGMLAVVVMAIGNVVTQAVKQGTLNVFSWDDWKVVAALAASATIAAVISYLQNALGIKPPKAS